MLDDLPATAQHLVFARLSVADVAACRLVCRGWQAAASAAVHEVRISADAAHEGNRLDSVAPFLRTLRVALPMPSRMLLPENVAAMNPPRTLRRLHIDVSDSNWVKARAFGAVNLSVHGPCFPGLREITVMCSTLFFDSQAAPLLRSIHVLFCHGPVASCLNLEVLRMNVSQRDYAPRMQDIAQLPKLVSLELDYSSVPLQRPSAGEVVDLLHPQILQRLQSLCLKGFRAGGAGLERLASCDHLTRLHICNEGWSRAPYVYALPPRVEDLCLHDAEADLLLAGMTSLRSLSLVNDGMPAPVPLGSIRAAPNLQHLSLQGYAWPRELGLNFSMPRLLSVCTYIPVPSLTGSFGALSILAKLAEACPTMERLTVFSLEIDAMCSSLDVTTLQTRCLPGWTGFLEQHPTPPWSLQRKGLTLVRKQVRRPA